MGRPGEKRIHGGKDAGSLTLCAERAADDDGQQGRSVRSSPDPAPPGAPIGARNDDRPKRDDAVQVQSRQIQDELAQRNDGFWVPARHAAAKQAGVDLGPGGHFAVSSGSSAGALEDLTIFEQVRAEAVAAGLVTAD